MCHGGTPHRRRTALVKYRNYSAQLEFVKEQFQRLNDYVHEHKNGRKGLAYHSCSANIVKYKIHRILCTVSFTAKLEYETSLCFLPVDKNIKLDI